MTPFRTSARFRTQFRFAAMTSRLLARQVEGAGSSYAEFAREGHPGRGGGTSRKRNSRSYDREGLVTGISLGAAVESWRCTVPCGCKLEELLAILHDASARRSSGSAG
jgi:hypothetical protein